MRWSVISLLGAWALSGAGACSGTRAADVPDEGDSGVDSDIAADTAFQVVPPAAPDAVAVPSLTPCPAGWRETTLDGVGAPACDPWPVGGAATCAADEAHFAGEPGCSRIGSACPVGEWPEALPAGATVRFVRAGGGTGGDGSQADPFGTIAAATSGAAAGTVIALGRGTFDEAVSLPGGVTLWGACIAATTVTCSVASTAAGTITVTGAAATVRNLTVSGQRPGVWVASAGRTVHLEDVLIAGATGYGWVLARATGNTGITVVIRDTQGASAPAISLQGGATLDLQRAVLQRNRDTAILVMDPATTLNAADLAVVDTDSAADGQHGEGLWLQGGGQAVITRGAFERNRETGVVALDPQTQATPTDVVVRDTAGRALDGAVVGNRSAGVRASTPGTSLRAIDLTVRGTTERGDGTAGWGLALGEGAQGEVTRGLFEGNRDLGIGVFHTGTTLVATDLAVRDTQARASDGLFGRGLSVSEGARLEVTRAAIERNRDVGVLVASAGTTALLTDLLVSDTASVAADGTSGSGLVVELGATAVVERLAVPRGRDVGVAAFHDGTVLTMSDVEVSETLAAECATGACAGFGGGRGVGAYAGAGVEMTRFVITRSTLCGVQLAYSADEHGVPSSTGGQMDLHEGEVSSNPIGANVQTEGFDTTRLTDRVVYEDNERNLDSTALPVPSAALPSTF